MPLPEEATIDPRLRAALRQHLDLTGKKRLLAFGSEALDPADAGAVAHLALCDSAPWPRGGPSCTVAADPLRLPFVEALFDLAVVTGVLETSDAPAALLRELRRVMAPAGIVWLVAPRRWLSLGQPVAGQHFSRAKLERLLVEAMLEPVAWEGIGGCYLIRAEPRGGVSSLPVGRVAARRVATA